MQYVQMAVDIVRDLELDQPPVKDGDKGGAAMTNDQLDRMRSYLASYYLASW